MTTTAKTIFESMKRIVEAPGYPLLRSYKDDFYKHDLSLLLQRWSSKARAIWVVTPNGTHLNFIGHHAKQIESVEASLSTGYANFEIYLLCEKGVTAISRERALAEARHLDFFVKGKSLLNEAGEKLATFEIEPCGQAYRNPDLRAFQIRASHPQGRLCVVCADRDRHPRNHCGLFLPVFRGRAGNARWGRGLW